MTARFARWSLSAPGAEDVGVCRDRVVALVRRWQEHLDEDCLEAIRLVVSEVVTNAVVHAAPAAPADSRRTQLTVTVAARSSVVLVVVQDASEEAPAPRRVGPDAEGGRGMSLVEALSLDHGWIALAKGKVVWVTLATDVLTAASVPAVPWPVHEYLPAAAMTALAAAS